MGVKGNQAANFCVTKSATVSVLRLKKLKCFICVIKSLKFFTAVMFHCWLTLLSNIQFKEIYMHEILED